MPDSLTQPTPAPQLPLVLRWGQLATWGDEMIDALESCNADKRAIKKLDAHRAQRRAEHAEN
ncbi:Rz1-like lysis system protein LysC [Pantoea agglomerans]|uniref:Rz1-like lysis system protein LysC n=1 Tax=Enterobacter agglomerans TaxID=549 RepID=UPI003D179CF0